MPRIGAPPWISPILTVNSPLRLMNSLVPSSGSTSQKRSPVSAGSPSESACSSATTGMPGDELAGVPVVDAILEQRMADVLADAAMDLTLEQQRIDHRAKIVDHDEAEDARRAGIGLDLDLADMAAIGEGRGLVHVARALV